MRGNFISIPVDHYLLYSKKQIFFLKLIEKPVYSVESMECYELYLQSPLLSEI